MNQPRDYKTLKSKSGTSMPLTAEGSLGLLALGDIGLELWRKAKSAKKATSIAHISTNKNASQL